MMEQLISYLWQSALVLTILYIPFQLLLRKEHFFALNRAILLGILLLSLALPLSRHTMPMFVDNWLHPEVEMEAAPIIPLGEYQDWDGDILIEDGDIEEPSSIEIHWTDLLIALWLLGTTIFLAWHTRGLWRLYKVLHDKDKIREELADGNHLLLTVEALPSFSWMHSIVISQEDYAENGETILLHERAHIAHLHSLDRLLLLVVQTVQWWNPFAWLLADALSQVHEYQADLAVLNQGINATQYQLLLIRKAAGPAGLALVNGFKRNKLKLRIVMMNNMIKLRGAKSRYLSLLPVALLAFALTAKAQEKTSEQEIESVKALSIVYPDGIEIKTKDNTPDPFVLVEGEVYEDWKNIDPGIIEAMTVYKADSDTVAHYSAIYEAAKYGVIMIELQEGQKQKPYKRKTVSSEEANEQAIQYVADVKESRIQPKENDAFMLEDLDVAPEFPNGGSFKSFINRKLRYPKSAAEKGIQGTVIVEFHIMKDGRIDYVKSFSNETNDKDLEAEAIRVVSSMPNWTPGKINNQNVNTVMYAPVLFKLNSTIEKQTIGESAYKDDDVRVVGGGVSKDLTLADIENVIDSMLLKSREIGEEYLKNNPKSKKSIVVMKDPLWEVDDVQMTEDEMEEKYPKIPAKFRQLNKDAEPLVKYSQYLAAKNGVNIIITGKE